MFGKVPTVSIDKTDGCQVYLSLDSLDVEVVTSKSSEMNILIPAANGDYVWFAIFLCKWILVNIFSGGTPYSWAIQDHNFA